MTARKPTRLKIVEGTARPDRMNEDEPQPDVLTKAPKPPAILDRFARGKWRELAPRLMRQRLLTEADLEMLAKNCSAISSWRRADEVLRRDGFTYSTTGTSGGEYQRTRPEVEIERDSWRRYVIGLTHFGQSPSSRPKVSASHEDYVDPAEEFLGVSSSAR